MKRILSILVALNVILFSATMVNAEIPIKVTLNGTEIAFDQPPVMQNDRTLVPLRAIFEALGATVSWDGDTQTVTAVKNGLVLKVTIGEYKLNKDGTDIALDVPATMVNDRTLVPVRAISEAFDCDVDWNGATQTVIIESTEINPNLKKLFEYTDEIKNEGEFNKTVDMNGTPYHITSKQIYDGGYGEEYDEFQFEVNGSTLSYDAGFFLYDVYLADLNTNDNNVELIISTVSESATKTVEIFQYNIDTGSFRQLTFANTHVMDERTNTDLFVWENYRGIIMNSDNSFTLTAKSDSHAMWGLRKTFRLNNNNVVEQDVSDKYDVDINEYVNGYWNSDSSADMINYGFVSSEYEYEMFKKGYALCNKSYGCLNKGDYFTVLYDDNNGNIYVEKEDGTGDWINIKSLSTVEREQISKLMFWLAS